MFNCLNCWKFLIAHIRLFIIAFFVANENNLEDILNNNDANDDYKKFVET